MMFVPRPLGRSLLLTTALLACSPLPSEVEPGPTSGPGDDTTVGLVSGPDTVTVTADSGDATMGGTDDTGPSFDPVCGDGIVEAPEECDLGGLNGEGMYCTDLCTTNICGDGYLGPGEACDDGNGSNADQCTTKCGLATCGDGVVQGGEECDDGENNDTSGACLPSCIAATCGDQFIEEGVESCDSNNIGTQTCEGLGFSGGVLLCARGCLEYDTTNCYACNDGELDDDEQCDMTELNGQTCISQGFDDGVLACSASCTFDLAGCISFTCGDGMINGLDQCDEGQLGGATCVTEGFAGGTITCSPGCTLDTTGCYLCGDNSVDPGEECDGMNLDGNDCGDLGMMGTPSGGMPACNGSCQLTEGTCTFCGDNVREGTEACDGNQLGGATCDDFAEVGETASGGLPACNASCMVFEGTCTFCGDGVRQGSEICDGDQLGGATCTSVLGPGNSGMLACDDACMFDTAPCCLDGGQPCVNDTDCCDNSCNGPPGVGMC